MRVISNDELKVVVGGEMKFFAIWLNGEGGGGSSGNFYGSYSGGGYSPSNYVTESWHEYEDQQRFKTTDQINADYSCDKGLLGGVVAGSAGGVLGMALGVLGGAITNGCFD